MSKHTYSSHVYIRIPLIHILLKMDAGLLKHLILLWFWGIVSFQLHKDTWVVQWGTY